MKRVTRSGPFHIPELAFLKQMKVFNWETGYEIN